MNAYFLTVMTRDLLAYNERVRQNEMKKKTQEKREEDAEAERKHYEEKVKKNRQATAFFGGCFNSTLR